MDALFPLRKENKMIMAGRRQKRPGWDRIRNTNRKDVQKARGMNRNMQYCGMEDRERKL